MEITPYNAENDGCSCALVDTFNQVSGGGTITYTGYAILVHEAPGWMFDHVEIDCSFSTGEITQDRYVRSSFTPIGEGGFRNPAPGTPHELSKFPVVVYVADYESGPYEKNVSRAVAVFVKVEGTGEILHGKTNMPLFGRSGTLLFKG